LTTASLAAVVPQIFIGPFAGAYVDRWNRRVVMIVADGSIALVSLILAILFRTDSLQVWHVYIVTLVGALGSTFHTPAMATATTLLVPDRYLARVAGLNQALTGIASIAGPPLGALLLSVLPLHYVMLVDVGTALMAIVPLCLVRIPQPPRDHGEDASDPSIWRDVREGLAYLRQRQGLLGLTIVSTLCNFAANPVFALLPLLIKEHFAGGAEQLSWMQAMQGLGLILGGLLLSTWGGLKRHIHTSLAGLILQGVTLLIVGLTPRTWFWLAALSWGVGACMNVFYNGAEIAILQSTVPVTLQGRVMAVMQSSVWIALPLSLLIAGPVADRVGPRLWYVVAGVISAAAGTVALFVPAIANVEQRAAPFPCSQGDEREIAIARTSQEQPLSGRQ
jgi:DHA3 family macrolide efflux protein-like MFS transporter